MSIQWLKNGKFQAQIRVPGERSVSKTFDTFEAAEEFEQSTIEAIRASRAVAETHRVYSRRMKPAGVACLASMKFAAIADEFAKAEPAHRHSRYVERLKLLVGDVRVSQFDKKWTKNFCARLRKVKAKGRNNFLAEGTIVQYISIVKRMCNWKAEELGIDKPKLGLTREFLNPGWDDGRERRLCGDEESRIREELGLIGAMKLWGARHAPGARGKPKPCARHYQLLFDFAIETCARQAEMVDLPWSEIDVAGRVWKLPASRSKTRTSRKIYLTPRAMEVVVELWKGKKLGNSRVFNLLPTATGVGDTFHNVIERLGIEDLKFHDLRHTGITRHRLEKNFEPEVLMRMVGHSSPKMTKIYFNPLDEEILAHMDAAITRREAEMLRKAIPEARSAAALAPAELADLMSEGLLASLLANPIALDEGLEVARAQLARRLQDFIPSPAAGARRL